MSSVLAETFQDKNFFGFNVLKKISQAIIFDCERRRGGIKERERESIYCLSKK